ncbi:unnamed protein product [Pleuronectes platessa]|uniref:Uncharacterized protein n=1 Tax=Pleuronectes platessa TaxID=8262 RepID=A0A9N7V7M2_PLEPL|nr:unnamed protein product [Pleuronectes platessa]
MLSHVRGGEEGGKSRRSVTPCPKSCGRPRLPACIHVATPVEVCRRRCTCTALPQEKIASEGAAHSVQAPRKPRLISESRSGKFPLIVFSTFNRRQTQTCGYWVSLASGSPLTTAAAEKVAPQLGYNKFVSPPLTRGTSGGSLGRSDRAEDDLLRDQSAALRAAAAAAGLDGSATRDRRCQRGRVFVGVGAVLGGATGGMSGARKEERERDEQDKMRTAAAAAAAAMDGSTLGWRKADSTGGDR